MLTQGASSDMYQSKAISDWATTKAKMYATARARARGDSRSRARAKK